MTGLIYTVGEGLREVTSLDFISNHELNAGGTYFRGRPETDGLFALSEGWYRRVHITDTLGDPYWHWEKTNKNELPKRLKAWALIMGIEL